MTNSRDKILRKIKESENVTLPLFEVNEEQQSFIQPEGNLAKHFQSVLEQINGTCILCSDEADALKQYKDISVKNKWNNVVCTDENIKRILKDISFVETVADFNAIDASITGCDFLTARTASVVVSSQTIKDKRTIAYSPTHIVFAREEQLYKDLDEVLPLIKDKQNQKSSSQITIISGPSRTADIEKTLILGAHGPKDFFVFLIQNKGN